MMSLPSLGIVAGTGALPIELAQYCIEKGRDYHIVHFEGIELDWLADHPVIPARFEKPNRLFKALKEKGCTEIVFGGAMQRPKLNPLKFDMKLMKLAPTLLPALKQGDDGTLRMIAGIFESEGFDIIGPHELLEKLTAPAGPLSYKIPNDQDRDDIKRGFQILNTISDADIGQACVIGQGLCLGIETIQGSNAMIDFASATKSQFLTQSNIQGVFVKAPKRGQDLRMDMPTIGPETVQKIADADLAGIAIQADSVQIIDRHACLSLANQLGIFITAYNPEDIA